MMEKIYALIEFTAQDPEHIFIDELKLWCSTGKSYSLKKVTNLTPALERFEEWLKAENKKYYRKQVSLTGVIERFRTAIGKEEKE